jgi:enamine deaminase RidA (YjgF/YER057c/UK114 family)
MRSRPAWIFLTGHEAFDFEHGIPEEVSGPSGFPLFGRPRSRREGDFILQRMRRILRELGSDLGNGVRLDQYYPTPAAVDPYHLARHAEFGDYIPPSTSVVMESCFAAETNISTSLIAVMPGHEIRKIFPPGVDSSPTSGFVPAVVCDDFVFVAGQMAHNTGHGLDPRAHVPDHSAWAGSELRKQTEFLIPEKLQPALAAAGSSLERSLKAQIYLARVEADRVVLSAGAIRSPHLLMLSGIGPADHLRQFGIRAIYHLPGVGQNLWNHLSAQVTFKVKDGVSLAAERDAVHFSLHYTAQGSSAVNDMVLRTSPVVDARQERVPGVRTRYLAGDVPPEQVARISCTLGLPDGSGYVRLASPDPSVQPAFNYRYLQHPNDIRRVREGLRLAASLLESDAYKDVVDYRIHPADDILTDDDALDLWIRQTVGTARHVSGTCKMGPDGDPLAVVDQYCRVKGVRGLWVADASVMPRIPRSGGAHATVIMIGERVVEWIAAS